MTVSRWTPGIGGDLSFDRQRPPVHCHAMASNPTAARNSAASLVPLAFFGIDNAGVGIFINLLIIFLVVIWAALVYWAYSDARRRIEDPVLVWSAVVAVLIFPFAGSVIYAIVRPRETADERLERELDMRAAVLRVDLLEQALKASPSGGKFAETVAGELRGEQGVRTSSERSSSGRPSVAPKRTAGTRPPAEPGGRPSQPRPPAAPAPIPAQRRPPSSPGSGPNK